MDMDMSLGSTTTCRPAGEGGRQDTVGLGRAGAGGMAARGQDGRPQFS
jgi:hypothetical protein